MHLPTHLFYEDEIFKTGHMVDHPVEDIMERVGCQFFTKVCAVASVRSPGLAYVSPGKTVHKGPPSKRRMVSWMAVMCVTSHAARFSSVCLMYTVSSIDVCVARYNEKEHLTVRIKNWNSCIPEVSPSSQTSIDPEFNARRLRCRNYGKATSCK